MRTTLRELVRTSTGFEPAGGRATALSSAGKRTLLSGSWPSPAHRLRVSSAPLSKQGAREIWCAVSPGVPARSRAGAALVRGTEDGTDLRSTSRSTRWTGCPSSMTASASCPRGSPPLLGRSSRRPAWSVFRAAKALFALAFCSSSRLRRGRTLRLVSGGRHGLLNRHSWSSTSRCFSARSRIKVATGIAAGDRQAPGLRTLPEE